MARTIEDGPGSYGPLIEAIAKDAAANRKEIASVDKRLDNTNVILSNMSFEVGGQRQVIAIMGKDVADTKDVVEAMNLRVIKIEAETAESSKRLARLEIDTGQRLSRLENAQNEMKATQVRQGDKLSDILAAVERLGGKSAQS